MCVGSLYVVLDSVEKIKNFLTITSNYDGELDLTSGDHVVSAKSPMAVITLDLTKKMRLDTYDDKKSFENLKTKLKDFIVDDDQENN
jgi:phosphotransferase system HPr-like phosphotransfer protein